MSNYLVSWIDFGTRVCQTRVLAQNSNYGDVFLVTIVAFVENATYRVPIVAFLTNPTKKMPL